MAAAGEGPRPSTSASAAPPGPSGDGGGREQELVLADVELDFVQLRRLEGPAEVFAAAPPAAASAAAAGQVLASVHNTPVPDHGAWVARLLPSGGAPVPAAAAPAWLDLPAATDAPLADFEDDLILLREEWWTLGFRFAVDIEVRAVVNWNGFQALADGLLRLFVLPGDGGPARAVLTTGHRLRARLATGAGPDPPALDLVVDAVAAPPAGPIPATLLPFEAPPPREPDKLTGLFPHQKRALAWALALEAEGADGGAVFEALESIDYAGRRFAATTAGPGPGSKLVGWPTRAHGALRVRRPSGGLLALPCGAGKSVIAVHLIKRSPRSGRMSLVVCPDHLVDQWLSYFRTHAPELRAGPALQALQADGLDVAVAGHGQIHQDGGAADAGEVRELLEATAWLRLVVDEPQELGKAETAFCVGHVRAAHRWCLTATPGDLHAIARLVLGTEIGRAHAVTLSWQEASVVRLWSVDGNVLPGRATRMDALIRLCSYFGAEEGESGAGLQFGGLEEWSAHHVALHKQRLAHLQTIRIPQLALELEKLGAVDGAAGDANILDVLDDLTTQEALDDRPEWELETAGAGEGPTAREREILGLSAEQLGMLAPEQRQEAVAIRARLRGLDDLDWTSLAEEFGETRAAEALQAARLRAELARARQLEEANERALRFLDETAAALSNPQAECNVCLEPLRGKQVAVLQCLHAFCGPCVDKVQQASTLSKLSKVKVPCPLCRTPTRVGELATFRLPGGAEAAAGGGGGGSRRASGSKLEALIALVQGILAEGDADTKLVVFAQFSSMLAALAAALRAAGIAAEVLLGPAIARHRAVAEFQRPGGSPVLCLTSRHVSGLNLHAASHVIFVHPYCNPSCASAEVVLLADAAAYETQAIGRIARYPNARSCHVHRIWCRGTIEEELYRVWGFIGEEEEGLPEGASEAASP